MQKNIFLKALCLLIYGMNALGSTVTAQPSRIVPPVEGISLLTTARYSIISSLLNRFSFDNLEHVLLTLNTLTEKEKNCLVKRYLDAEESLNKDLQRLNTKYTTKKGWMSTTYNQGKLYAIEKKMGLDSYIKARYLFIPEITDEYDFALLSLSIDNNIPVILQNEEKTYLCLAYDDSSIIVADLAKVTGSRALPLWSSRITDLKKAKNLSENDKKWLEEYEEKLRTGNYQTDYVDYHFTPRSAENALNRPFLSSIPRDSFQGKMTIITPPKTEFDKIIRRFGGWR